MIDTLSNRRPTEANVSISALRFGEAFGLEEHGHGRVESVSLLSQELSAPPDAGPHPLGVVAVRCLEPERERSPNARLDRRVDERAMPRGIITGRAEREDSKRVDSS